MGKILIPLEGPVPGVIGPGTVNTLAMFGPSTTQVEDSTVTQRADAVTGHNIYIPNRLVVGGTPLDNVGDGITFYDHALTVDWQQLLKLNVNLDGTGVWGGLIEGVKLEVQAKNGSNGGGSQFLGFVDASTLTGINVAAQDDWASIIEIQLQLVVDNTVRKVGQYIGISLAPTMNLTGFAQLAQGIDVDLSSVNSYSDGYGIRIRMGAGGVGGNFTYSLFADDAIAYFGKGATFGEAFPFDPSFDPRMTVDVEHVDPFGTYADWFLMYVGGNDANVPTDTLGMVGIYINYQVDITTRGAGSFVGLEVRLLPQGTGNVTEIYDVDLLTDMSAVVGSVVEYFGVHVQPAAGAVPVTAAWGMKVDLTGIAAGVDGFGYHVLAGSGAGFSGTFWGLQLDDSDAFIGGELYLGTVGQGLLIKEGANAVMGRVALGAGGTVVVATNKVTAISEIFLTSDVPGGTPGSVRVSARTPGTSFTITSSLAGDTSTVSWLIIEPA